MNKEKVYRWVVSVYLVMDSLRDDEERPKGDELGLDLEMEASVAIVARDETTARRYAIHEAYRRGFVVTSINKVERV